VPVPVLLPVCAALFVARRLVHDVVFPLQKNPKRPPLPLLSLLPLLLLLPVLLPPLLPVLLPLLPRPSSCSIIINPATGRHRRRLGSNLLPALP
jgi:hypothetical protein